MSTNYQKIKTYISSIEKYQIKSIDLNANNEIISINYKILHEDINDINKDLISALIKDSLCKDLFFDKIEDIYVFNQNKFIEIIFKTNEYMEGSYTKYSSNIGLFLKDEDKIQLNFPYKDCVLVGGMDKEDDKVNLEVFYNEVLDRNKINKLFEPKVFHNIKRHTYSKDLAEDEKLDNSNNIQTDNEVDNIKFETIIDENGIEKQRLSDNLLIKGNNLLGLHSLARRLSGSIDVIYIDPPYYFNQTKASDSFAYNSNFKLSTWLTFMKNRLEIARELLSDEGVIFISMNEDGNSHLKLLCDDVFGVENFVTNMPIINNSAIKNNSKLFSKMHEQCIVYSANFNKVQKLEKENHLINNVNKIKNSILLKNISNEEKRLELESLLVEYYSSKQYKDEIKILGDFFDISDYWLVDENLEIFGYSSLDAPGSKLNFKIFHPITKEQCNFASRGWSISKENYEKMTTQKIVQHKKNDNLYYTQGLIIYGKDANTKIPGKIKFLSNNNFLIMKSYLNVSNGTQEYNNLQIKESFQNPKPIYLIKELLRNYNNKNSTILDFFAGSGTTAHSVLSLNKEDNGNRKFILLEQMDYIENITAERIKRCMIKEGYEDSFIYMEMKESNIKELKNYIKSSKSKEELISLINDNFNNGYFINIDNKEQLLLQIENIYSNAKNNKSNPLNDSIKLVMEKHMDNNLDYVSYEDIEELKLSNQIKENEYKLNKSFYEEV